MSRAELARQGAELVLEAAIQALDRSSFQGSRISAWRKGNTAASGLALKKQLQAYIADMDKAIANFDAALAYYESLAERAKP